METIKTSLKDLQPGDKIFVEWPSDRIKPNWWKLPDIVTVREVDLKKGQVMIRESGGLCLESKELDKIKEINPVPGDTIVFNMETYNDLNLCVNNEFRAVVESISTDPLKRREPNYIVTIDGEAYGIPFSDIKKIEKIRKNEQLSMF